MHELGIINSMVKTIGRIVQAEGLTQVKTLVLEVGELSGVVPHYMQQCWPAAVYKTVMQATALDLRVVPGIVKCRGCGRVVNALAADRACPGGGGADLESLSGNDVVIREIECC